MIASTQTHGQKKEVSEMARFLNVWHVNPVAWPADPVESAKIIERGWAVMDDLIKKGLVKEFGFFLSSTDGYAIGEGESADAFRSAFMFTPYWVSDVHEIMPYEKGKEILRVVMKAAAQK